MTSTNNFRPVLSIARACRRMSEDLYMLSHVKRLLSRVDHPDPKTIGAVRGELAADFVRLQSEVLKAVADRLGAP